MHRMPNEVDFAIGILINCVYKRRKCVNDARMTIRLPGEMLLFAQNYAKKSRISLSELVLRYFKQLKTSFLERDGLPESIRDVVGILPADVDAEAAYHDHIAEKYL